LFKEIQHELKEHTGIKLSLYGSHISGSIPFKMPWNLGRCGEIAGFPETSFEYVLETCQER